MDYRGLIQVWIMILTVLSFISHSSNIWLTILLAWDRHARLREFDRSVVKEVRRVNTGVPQGIMTFSFLLHSALSLAVLLSIWSSVALIGLIRLADTVQLLALSSPVLLLWRWLNNLAWVLIDEHAFAIVIFPKAFVFDLLYNRGGTWLINH